MYKVDILFPGFSGRMKNGRLGWGTTALVQDEKHNILMDCGGMVIRSDLKRMLKERGLECEDIDMVLISHLHADHTYNIDYFPQATFVLSYKEWLHGNDMVNRDYSVNENAVHLLRGYRKIFITEDNQEILPGLTAMLTPGHTPGSTSYILDQGDKVWIMSGDAVKNRGELKFEEIQQSRNMEDSINSLKKIKKAADRILPGHDGWLTIEDGEVIPEGNNDVELQFAQGIKVNGQEKIILTMGW